MMPMTPTAAAERDGQPAGQPARPLTAVVLDLRGVEPRVLAESHRAERTHASRIRNPPGRRAPDASDTSCLGRRLERRLDPMRLLVLQVATADEEDRHEQAGERDRRARPERRREPVGQGDRRLRSRRERVDPSCDTAIVVRIAIPTAPPICCDVLMRPEARPASCGFVPATAAIVTAT